MCRSVRVGNQTAGRGSFPSEAEAGRNNAVKDTPPIHTVIFDMDGVLLDSEPLWQQAEIEVFATVGVTLDHERCRETMGLRSDEVVAYWYARYPWTGPSLRDVEEEVLRTVTRLIRAAAEPRLGLDAVLRVLATRSVRLALASSSPYALITAVLERLGLTETFACIHSAEEEPYGKPHPGVYLTTARKLGVAPEACCAIEDSANGVLAAKAARMTCVAVPDPGIADDPRLAIADRRAGSLADLDGTAWDALGVGIA